MYFWWPGYYMKKTIILASALFFFCGLQAQDKHDHPHSDTTTKQAEANLDVKEVEFDFGKIPQGKPVFHYFEVINKGTIPIKIDNVQTSCGCTTPEWSKDPIAPGASTQVKVGYNAASEGPFDKFITLQYNGNATKQIKIKGIVWKAPVGAAPSNPSIQFLKQQTL
jgi:hypothetical protein